MGNEHYATQEELLWALADALREEYRAIVEAGFQLQVDDAVDPGARGTTSRTSIWRPTGVLPDPCRGAQPRAGGPARGARPLPPLLGQLARAARDRHPARRDRRPDARGATPAPTWSRRRTSATSTSTSSGRRRQAAGREEARSRAWSRTPTNLIEHPELVAERIVRLRRARRPRERDRGHRLRDGHRASIRELGWAKLAALAEGARLATERLWGDRAMACSLAAQREKIAADNGLAPGPLRDAADRHGDGARPGPAGLLVGVVLRRLSAGAGPKPGAGAVRRADVGLRARAARASSGSPRRRTR